ncbi:MAG: N-acetyltransferase [Clostridia bacterium]|nr:N-acetyltransferase [Clostridia bacterium]
MALSNLNVTTDRILFDLRTLKGYVECYAFLEKEKVCSCKVDIDTKDNIWTIVSWFTNEKLQGQGIGKRTLAKALYKLYEMNGVPKEIEYNWNGSNSYVLEWMEKHFDAKCFCSIEILKEYAGDCWDSHRYNLNVCKVLDYFGIE